MNRLIIIGNGFDLAHNLKTRYYDFIFNYVKSCFQHAESNGHYKDDLFEIQKFYRVHMTSSIEAVENLDTFLEFVKGINDAYASLLGDSSYESPTKRFSWKFSSKFIRHLIKVCHGSNWVDIENEYYNALKEILNITNEKTKKKEIENLNQSFQFIVEKLEKYLSGISPTFFNPAYKTLFSEMIKKIDIIKCNLRKNESPANTMVLNFQLHHYHRTLLFRW